MAKRKKPDLNDESLAKTKDKGTRQQHQNRIVNQGPRTCPTCNGKGFIAYDSAEADEDGIFDGTGSYRCDACNGTGVESQ